MPIVLYASEQFQDVTRSPAWAAASYDGTIRVPVGGALEADDITWATSAVAVHRLLDEIGGAGVANLIRDLGEGADFDQAFAHRAQEPFNDFIARLAP